MATKALKLSVCFWLILCFNLKGFHRALGLPGGLSQFSVLIVAQVGISGSWALSPALGSMLSGASDGSSPYQSRGWHIMVFGPNGTHGLFRETDCDGDTDSFVNERSVCGCFKLLTARLRKYSRDYTAHGGCIFTAKFFTGKAG